MGLPIKCYGRRGSWFGLLPRTTIDYRFAHRVCDRQICDRQICDRQISERQISEREVDKADL
jgi:hypothetical protein